jgi:protein phosphatase
MDQHPDHWKKSVRYAALSDIGLRRANNQDSFAVKIAATPRQWLDRGHLFIVADGMGAHVAGEVASRLAAETVMQSYLNRSNESPSQALRQAVYDAHRIIRDKSKHEEAYRDMGTTCDAFALTPQGLWIAHVGDSRVYRLRDRVLEQMTFDHSLVWEVCLTTNLPFDQPPSYIPKNQITRSLGPTEKLTVDLEGPFPIVVGDVYLACSDGLSGQVADKEIGQLLAVSPPDTAAETLINLANLRGGPDNITLVIAQPTDSPAMSQAVDEELLIPGWHWGIMGGAALCGLGAVAGFVLGSVLLGGMLAVCCLVATGFFFTLTQNTLFKSSPFLSTYPPSGKGPYTKSDATPSENFAATLAKILYELRQAAKGLRFDISSAEAASYEKEATKAVKTNDFASAIKNYALAINHLMRELKKLKAKK